jgi:hypothetical protein
MKHDGSSLNSLQGTCKNLGLKSKSPS